MSSLQNYLDDLYNDSDAKASGHLEKSAEAIMLDGLQTEAPAVNEYEDMSLEDLMKIASQVGVTVEEPAVVEPTVIEEPVEDDVMAKVAEAKVSGEVMAHSFLDEMEAIKIATLSGLCRVCKENPMDLESSTICSVCAGVE
jgi:hypothetical protein